MTQRKFKLLPDPKDERDYVFKATRYATAPLPESVDLRPQLSPIVDQGGLGSCTANAIASGFREHLEIKDGQPLNRLSRLFLYYKERELIGTVDQDSGAYIRDGMKILANTGCPPETFFPYVESAFRDKPSADAEVHAAPFKIREYHRITSFLDLQHALAEGLTVVLGMTVFESFASIGKDGIFLMPKDGESVLGGHAMLGCGYKLINGIKHIVTRNSWGEQWGDGGYCYIPEDYFRKTLYVTDIWTGVEYVTIDSISVDQAVDIISSTIDPGTKEPIFDSPEFWKNLAHKYENDPTSDFRYVGLEIRKIAAFIKNNS